MKLLKELNFSAESIRYQLLSAHYRTKVNFSKLKKNENDRVVQRFLSFYNLLKINNADIIENTNLPDEYLKFKEKMNNDLDAPQALGVFFVWMKKTTNEIINKKISKEEVSKAHIAIQKKIHPDISPETARLSSIVNEAKDLVLKNIS